MGHYARTRSDGTWTTGNYVTIASDWADLNTKVFGAINGDKGGSWSPSSLITLTGSSGGHLRVTGKTLVAYGGSLQTASLARFKLPGSTWPLLAEGHVGRSRTIFHSMFQCQTLDRVYWKQVLGKLGSNSEVSGIQTPFCSYQAAGGIVFSPSCILPLRVHDGSRIVSATFRFRVPVPRSKALVVPPKFRLVRADLEGNLVNLSSTANNAATDSNGYQSMAAAASGSDWYNNGDAQGFTYVCDQNNIVDVSQYSYYAQLQEERGAVQAISNSQIDGVSMVERKADCRYVSISNIALTGNGYGAGATGNRILITGQTVKQQNGIWVINLGGAWSRAGDLSSPSNFTPNFIVGVGDGVLTQYWQIKRPQAPQSCNVGALSTDNTGDEVEFSQIGRIYSYAPGISPVSQLRGNIYHSLLLTMDSIVDMRFQ